RDSHGITNPLPDVSGDPVRVVSRSPAQTAARDALGTARHEALAMIEDGTGVAALQRMRTELRNLLNGQPDFVLDDGVGVVPCRDLQALREMSVEEATRFLFELNEQVRQGSADGLAAFEVRRMVTPDRPGEIIHKVRALDLQFVDSVTGEQL